MYDGDAMVMELNSSGAILRRFVHGSNAEADDPLIWYEGSAVSAGARRFLMANHQGSIIAVTNYTGTLLNANTYDEYGINGTANMGRFQYTGQVWLEELGLYYYKARIYSPTLGRFLQTDPIGYEDQYNLYAYGNNDPINGADPDGERWRYINPYRPSVGSYSYVRQTRREIMHIQVVIPTYRAPASARAAGRQPSARAAYSQLATVQAQSNHISVIGRGAFRGVSMRGEGSPQTVTGRIQYMFSQARYDNPTGNGYHFTNTRGGGMAAARRDFDALGLSNVRPTRGGGAGYEATYSVNGSSVQVQVREGGGRNDSYARIEVQVTTPRTENSPKVQTRFKIKYE